MTVHVPDDKLPHKGMTIHVPDVKLLHKGMTIYVPDSVESNLTQGNDYICT